MVDESITKAIELRQQDKKNKCPHCGPIGDQVIYTPLVDLREARESEIVFNSRSPKTMEVSPTFYKADGTQIVAEKVSIKSQEIRYVKIKDLLPKYARGVRDSGGMTLSYYGTNREMWAQMRFLKVNSGSSVDEFFTVVSESRSDLYEAAWWTPKDSSSIIALGNVTGEATSVNVRFGDQPAQVVSLAPHGTQIVRQEGRSSDRPASVRLEVIGAAGSVVPTGIISSPTRKLQQRDSFLQSKADETTASLRERIPRRQYRTSHGVKEHEFRNNRGAAEVSHVGRSGKWRRDNSTGCVVRS
ncbi:MAG TPA: hypothetical protein VGJ37_00330 [Pyrinomonadaceae bacterium]